MDDTTAAFFELIDAEFPGWNLDDYVDLYEPAPIRRNPKDEQR